jgi:FixJ family two-component response regulator
MSGCLTEVVSIFSESSRRRTFAFRSSSSPDTATFRCPVQAIKGGAIEFLTKPFRDQDLLDAIQLGLERDRAWLENDKAIGALRARFETLSPREREVMALVVTGRFNKQIADDIGISEITVKVHRGQVMRKMKAASLPDLARMADKLNFKVEKFPSS